MYASPLYVANGAPLTVFAAARHDWGPWLPVPDAALEERLVERFCPCGADQIQPLDAPQSLYRPFVGRHDQPAKF